jgi:hypothetical protein
MIHDCNSTEYKGAKEAVLKFSAENAAPYVPLGDICGSLVICKV